MRIPPTNCPSCNSLQRFAPRERVEGGRIVRYIVCSMCRTETVLDTLTVDEVRARRTRTRLRNRAIRHSPIRDLIA